MAEEVLEEEQEEEECPKCPAGACLDSSFCRYGNAFNGLFFLFYHLQNLMCPNLNKFLVL